jgi:hypothetical protein
MKPVDLSFISYIFTQDFHCSGLRLTYLMSTLDDPPLKHHKSFHGAPTRILHPVLVGVDRSPCRTCSIGVRDDSLLVSNVMLSKFSVSCMLLDKKKEF